MKICIIDGHQDRDDPACGRIIQEVERELVRDGHSVRILPLRDMDIRYCTGCWSCWWATPGECVFQDESHTVCREYIQSDFVLFFSPLKMGFVSALIKKTQDKLIPLVHPYITLLEGECHHHKRYENYPRVGLLLHPQHPADDEDKKITEDMFRRFALNLRSSYLFTKTTDEPTKDICHAMHRF